VLYFVGVGFICNSPRCVLNRFHTIFFVVNHCAAQALSNFMCNQGNLVGRKCFDVPPWNASEQDGRACSSGSHDSRRIKDSCLCGTTWY
jgi:hypothetical protein